MMEQKKILFVLAIAFFTWSFSASADTSKIDNIAACAGVVIGNGAVDFYMGDEGAFNGAADIAYSAYLSAVFEAQHSQSDLQIADQILAVNLDKIIAAYNNQTFDNVVYEEVVGCYRILSLQLLKSGQTIIENQQNWEQVKQTSIKTIKRVLNAS
tara:strand:+ start:32 stop:496 length:465 start_codon:yes stop_codon:yes gene_type:complete